ncbi:MAG: ThuA domain-containing protein [Planctomycetota bacterium]
MKKVFCLFCLASLLALGWGGGACAADAAAEKKIRVLLTFGGHGFEEQLFFAIFDALPGVTYTKAVMPKDAGLLKPGLEKDYDVIVMYDMSPTIKPEEQKAFVELLKTGIGVVSLHHNLGAQADWDEYRKIIGGKFILKDCEIDGQKYGKSGWREGQEHNITVVDKEHPITKGLQDFKIHDETYCKCYVAPNVKVLLKTDNPTNNPEIAWVNEYGKSRVFYCQFGHDHFAWDNPNFKQILSNGIKWACAKE